jgi:putative GTP pyrophosphokinase
MILVPSPEEKEIIDPLVQHFEADLSGKHLVSTFMSSVLTYIKDAEDLRRVIHSIRSRVKEPDHLADKLLMKLRECKEKGVEFPITVSNLFTKINDLAGIRILHLHTRQITAIDRYLKAIIQEQPVRLIEGPFARTWDDENRAFFKSINIETQDSETMYTSVHYILASGSSTTVTCEIQVRTLMEEVWGEVDHAINYPHQNESVACREQILALARSTSSATRLVDAIFATVADLESQKAAAADAFHRSAPIKRKRRKDGGR